MSDSKRTDSKDTEAELNKVFETYEVPPVQRAFGHDVGLTLRVPTDPKDGRNFLWVNIIMDGRRDAVKRMDRLLRVWVMKAPLEVRHYMSFIHRRSREWVHLAKMP